MALERRGMSVVTLAARLLLGLMFLVFGLNGFLNFIPRPPIGGEMANFMTVLFVTHYSVLIFGTQAICGVLLLTDQYVTLALTALAAVFANILTFHATMNPQGFPTALIALALWFIVCWSRGSQFTQLLARRPIPASPYSR